MVSCIVLAAGSSSRFGSPKPLARFRGEPVLTYLLKNLLKAKLEEIIVVLGSDSAGVNTAVVKDERIRPVVNENYSSGQTSSFKKGLSEISSSAECLLLIPADTFLVRPRTIDEIAAACLKKTNPVIIPVYKGRSGHPPAFEKQLFREFKALSDKEPLYTVQHRHAEDILKLPVYDEGVVLSFNTPQELEILKSYTVT